MAGKRDQFWALLEPEQAKIRAFCRRLAGHREDGDDLCQEALVQAFQRFDSLKEHDRFKPWLYRIAVNRYRNARRRSFWRRLVPFGNGTGPELPGVDPSEAYEAGRLLDRAFKGIDPADRALIVLFETEGWSAGELGQLFGASAEATRVRLHRIRRKMRKVLVRHAARVAQRHKAVIEVGEERYAL